MALLEDSLQPDRATQPANRNLSRGNTHSKRIKDAMRFNRLCRKHASELFDEQLRLAKAAESEAIRKDAGQYLLNRAFGLPSSAPEDQATQLAIATILADMRPALALKLWPSVTPTVTPAVVTIENHQRDQELTALGPPLG